MDRLAKRLNAGALLSSSAAGCFAAALLGRSQSLGDIVQNILFRTMRLIRGARRKPLPRVRGSWVRDHSPGVDRRDKCRWPNVSELTCRAVATGASVKIAKRIRKM